MLNHSKTLEVHIFKNHYQYHKLKHIHIGGIAGGGGGWRGRSALDSIFLDADTVEKYGGTVREKGRTEGLQKFFCILL